MAASKGGTAKRGVVSPLSRLRAICGQFHEFHEVMAWGEPTFRVKNKLFAMYGWVGVHVDKKVDWDEVAALLKDGYRLVAPKRVLAAFGAERE